MFERMKQRVNAVAERRVRARTAALAERLREELPGGIKVAADADGVRLSARGIVRRFALDPALRWMSLR